MNSIANLLLRIVGDTSDAENDLEELARELADFGRTREDAEVGIDTKKARAELDRVVRDLRAFAREVATAGADVNADAAHAKIDRLRFRLEELGAVNVDPEIDIDIAGAVGQLALLDKALDGVDDRGVSVTRVLGGMAKAVPLVIADMFGMVGAAQGVSQALGGATAGLGTFATIGVTAATTAAIAAAVMAILAVALAGVTAGLGALAISAGAALAALGVIGVAFGGAFLAAATLAVGTILRFKEQMNIAGTAAFELKEAAEDLGFTFKRALGPAAESVMRAIAATIRAVIPVVKELRDPFLVLAQAMGGAFGKLRHALADPAIQAGLAGLILGMAELVGPITSGMIALAEVLLNIANAAMPFLVSGAESVAEALRSWADSTSDAGRLEGTIGTLVGHLKEWLRLTGGILEFVGGVFIAGAPAAKEFVTFLADGAQALGEWANSAEGREQIRAFFEDVLPLVQEFIRFVGDVIVLFLRFGQTVAPVLAPIVGLFTTLVGAAADVIGALGGVVEFIKGPLIAAVLALVAPWALIWGGVVLVVQNAGAIVTAVWTAAQAALAAIWSGISSAASSAWNGIRTAVTTAVNATTSAATSVWNAAGAALSGIWSGIRGTASSVWNAIERAITGQARQGASIATSVWDAASSALSGIWSAIRGTASSIWNAIEGAITGAIGDARDAAVDVARTMRTQLGTIWESIVTNAGSVLDGIAGAVRGAVEAGLNVITGLVGAFFSAGVRLAEAIGRGILSAAERATAPLRRLAQQLRDILPFSEPKDPNSPLRGLGKAGAAIIDNMLAGLAEAGPRAIDALQTEIAGMAAVVNVSPAAFAGVGQSVREGDSYDISVNAPPTGGGFDARAAVMELTMLIRNRGGLPA